jgi:hypothetical protein
MRHQSLLLVYPNGYTKSALIDTASTDRTLKIAVAKSLTFQPKALM